MDKLEYIPGDLVTNKYYTKVLIVIKTVKNMVYTRNRDAFSETYLSHKDDVVTMLLTPEILEKNGWKSINGKYALKIKNANYVVLEFTEDGIYTYINEKTMLFTIKYIHELQHLLFGLGIKHEMEV